jgi:hypothetical protein
MKTILKTVLFIFLGCIITITSSAQQHTSTDSLIIGKWKLKSSWIKRNGKTEYKGISGAFVYEFNRDGTFSSCVTGKGADFTSCEHGSWELIEDGKKLRLFECYIENNNFGKAIPVPGIEIKVVGLSSRELKLHEYGPCNEEESTTEQLFTNLYTRIN